jgi:hypothetical protein
MLVYAEYVCTAARARSHAPLAHFLGGLAFGALGRDAWLGVLAVFASARARGPARAPLWLAAFSALGLGVGALWALRRGERERDERSVVVRAAWAAALWLVAAWRLDDVLCVSEFPVGVARAFVLWLGAALLEARGVRARVALGAYAFAHAAVPYAPGAWLRILVCAATLVAARVAWRTK